MIMKKSAMLLSLVCTSLLIQSCSSGSSTNKNESSPDLIYTSVAASLTAAANNKPTSTSTPEIPVTSTPAKETVSIPTLAQVAMTSASDALVCDNAAYIGDVTIPDGTIVSPGETFTKTWRVQNSGSCNWNTSYLVSFNSGETMSGVSTAFPYAVSSGNQMDISVSMIAPTDLGTYIGYWKLQNSAGTIFGQTLYVQITVATSTSTRTPTITSTSEETSTPTSTTAPTETEVVVPTSTPETIAEATATPE
jgi:hypothetical protein